VLGVRKASRKVEVHFVDTGKCEVMECKELRDMPAMFLSDLPVQAIACSLYGTVEQTGSVSMWSPADVDTFSDMVCDQLLKVYFTHSHSSSGHYVVHLFNSDNNENIIRKFLLATNRLSHSHTSPSNTKAAGDASLSAKRSLTVISSGVDETAEVMLRGYHNETLKQGEQADCVAAYVVSPSQFYLHKQSNTDALEAMTDELNASHRH